MKFVFPFLLLLGWAFSSFSQDATIPFFLSAEAIKEAGIKSVSEQIFEDNRWQDGQRSEYDQNGNEVYHFEFQRHSLSELTYDKKDRVVNEIITQKKKYLLFDRKTLRDKSGKIISINYTLPKIEIEDKYTEEYHYKKNGQIDKIDVRTPGNAKNFNHHIVKKYAYNKKGKIVSISSSSELRDTTIFFFSRAYEYHKNGVTKMEHISSPQFDTLSIKKFNEEGQLISSLIKEKLILPNKKFIDKQAFWLGMSDFQTPFADVMIIVNLWKARNDSKSPKYLRTTYTYNKESTQAISSHVVFKEKDTTTQLVRIENCQYDDKGKLISRNRNDVESSDSFQVDYSYTVENGIPVTRAYMNGRDKYIEYIGADTENNSLPDMSVSAHKKIDQCRVTNVYDDKNNTQTRSKYCRDADEDTYPDTPNEFWEGTFSSDGNVLTEIIESEYQPKVTKTHTYNSETQLLEKTITNDGFIRIAEYEKGSDRILKHSYFNENTSTFPFNVISYSYEKDGSYTITHVSQDSLGNRQYGHTIEYINASNQKTMKSDFDSEGIEEFRETYEYNEKGLPIGSRMVIPDWREDETKYIYEYY